MKKLKELFMKDWFFFIIAICICAGVMGSVHMYMVHDTGYLNGLAGGQLLKNGDFATAAGYGGGFLIARVLEGPLVGLFDIGGGMMHGIGCGIAGLMYELGLGVERNLGEARQWMERAAAQGQEEAILRLRLGV